MLHNVIVTSQKHAYTIKRVIAAKQTAKNEVYVVVFSIKYWYYNNSDNLFKNT